MLCAFLAFVGTLHGLPQLISGDTVSALVVINESGHALVGGFFGAVGEAPLMNRFRSALPFGSVEITLIHHPNSCDTFSALFVADDGAVFRRDAYQVCRGRTNNLVVRQQDRYQGVSGLVRTSAPSDVTVRNLAGCSIVFLFVAFADSAAWGVDLVESDGVFPSASSRTYHVFNSPLNGRVEFLAVLSDGRLIRGANDFASRAGPVIVTVAPAGISVD